MEIDTIPMTAKIPSGTGMPICGHASGSFVAFGTSTVVRDRQAAAKGDMGLAYVPGTNAWSPPSS